MSRHYDFRYGQPPAASKPCACGHPKAAHRRTTEDSRPAYLECQRPECLCERWKAPETDVAA